MTSPLEQKLKITGPVVVTANRLGDGAVIYRTHDGGWSTRLGEAAVVTTTGPVILSFCSSGEVMRQAPERLPQDARHATGRNGLPRRR